MAGNLTQLIDKTDDLNVRKRLWERYVDLKDQIDKMANLQFEENDDFYKETIEKIIETEALFKDYEENQEKLLQVLKQISDIIASVGLIFYGWQLENEK